MLPTVRKAKQSCIPTNVPEVPTASESGKKGSLPKTAQGP